MASSPGYAATPIHDSALLTTADTSRTAPSAAAAFFTPGVNGGMCERITVTPVATVVASVIGIFEYDGTTHHLLFEIGVPAQTLTNGQAVQDQVFSAVSYPNRFPIMLKANHSLRATVHDAQTGIKIHGEGGGL